LQGNHSRGPRETAKPDTYGSDRVFAIFQLANKNKQGTGCGRCGARKGRSSPSFESRSRTCTPSPGIFPLGNRYRRAGSIIGINAFTSRTSEASKIETKKLTSQYESTGSLPAESRLHIERRQTFCRREKYRRAFPREDLGEVLKTHLSRIGAGDYFAVLATFQ